MRRTSEYQIGMVAALCLLGLCGTGRGAIGTHLKWVSVRQGQSFSSSNATTAGYLFALTLRTDNTVSSAEFTTPMGLVGTIPATAHASSGDVQTSHKVGYGDIHVWEYQAWFNSIEGLGDYGDGTYTIKLNYNSGGPETTTVPYVVPGGGSNPIPQPTQKPVITAPAFGASVAPPVAFTWNSCTDVNVPDDAGDDEIALHVYDCDDTDKLPKLFGKTATGTGSDPCGIDDGLRSAQLMFMRRYTFYNPVHNIPCEVIKGSATMHEFEVKYSKVHRLALAGSTTCHFWTAVQDERNFLRAVYGSVWLDDNTPDTCFYACTGKHYPDLEEVYRLYNQTNNDHFYTTSEAERDSLLANHPWVFIDEGIAFYAYLEGARPPETVPIYRMWHQVDGMHYYTDDVAERDQMLTPPTSWWLEGIEFYAYP